MLTHNLFFSFFFQITFSFQHVVFNFFYWFLCFFRHTNLHFFSFKFYGRLFFYGCEYCMHRYIWFSLFVLYYFKPSKLIYKRIADITGYINVVRYRHFESYFNICEWKKSNEGLKIIGRRKNWKHSIAIHIYLAFFSNSIQFCRSNCICICI